MARDLKLLERAEAGELGWRVYTWDGLWVSLGRNQAADEVLRDPDTAWVSRPTGGSAVIHGHDVTVSIAIPLLRRADSYRVVTTPLISALQSMGHEVALAEDLNSTCKTYREAADCFATTTRNDLVNPSSGLKVCGCALRRTRSAVLLQASIPVSEPLAEPADVLFGGVRTEVTQLDSEELRIELGRALATMQ